MTVSPADHRILKMIFQNVILSSHVRDGDIIDPSTGKRAIPDDTADRLIASSLAAWEWDEALEEFRLVLTREGQEQMERQ